jgi:Ca-activated chloride channel family protein
MVRVLLPLAALLIAQAPPVASQTRPAPETARFSSGVNLVTVTAVVHDRQGRPVRNLAKDDFAVFDDGNRRAIVGFGSEPGPASVAVLVDVSGSMNVSARLASARQAVDQLLSWMEPGRDEVALFAFDTRLVEVQAFTTEPARVSLQLQTLRPYGATSLYDAIVQTSRQVVVRRGSRRAVVVVTDGIDTSSRFTQAEASSLASSVDVPVYVLAVMHRVERDLAGDRAGAATPGSRLLDLSWWGGGQSFVVSTPADASLAARQIVGELRHQYVMAIEPGTRPGWHALNVHVRRKNVVVRARSGYVGGLVSTSGS